MALGVTFPLGRAPLAEQRERLQRVLDLGYTDVWTMETGGLDALTPLALAAAWAPRARLGSAIASVFTRGPALLAMEAASLAEAAPGRFVLGLGTSSRAIVAGWNGVTFERPLARMRDVVRFLRRAWTGGRVEGPFETLATAGFRLERPPRHAPPIWIGGLLPAMLALAGREGDGALLSMVSPGDLATLRADVDAEVPLGLRIGVLAGHDEAPLRARARARIAAYLSVEGYAAMHRRLGRAELLAPMWDAWRRGDRETARAAVPEALLDDLYAIGSAEACAERIAAFRDAGLDLPIVSCMTEGPETDRALAAIARRLA